MFKLKYSEIRDPRFVQAFSKLANFGGYKDAKSTYNIARMAKLIEQQQRAAIEDYQKVAKDFAVLDDAGKIKLDDNQRFEVPDEKKSEFDEATREFFTREVEIQRHRIRLDEVEGVGLSPMELLALEPVMVVLEAVSEAV